MNSLHHAKPANFSDYKSYRTLPSEIKCCIGHDCLHIDATADAECAGLTWDYGNFVSAFHFSTCCKWNAQQNVQEADATIATQPGTSGPPQDSAERMSKKKYCSLNLMATYLTRSTADLLLMFGWGVQGCG